MVVDIVAEQAQRGASEGASEVGRGPQVAGPEATAQVWVVAAHDRCRDAVEVVDELGHGHFGRVGDVEVGVVGLAVELHQLSLEVLADLPEDRFKVAEVLGGEDPTPVAADNNGKRAYMCRRAPDFDGCGKLAVIAEPVEAIITEAVLRVTDTPNLSAAVSAEAGRATPVIASLEARQAELAGMWAAGEMTRAQFNAASKVLADELGAARDTLAASAVAAIIEPYVTRPGLLRSRWADLSLDQQRQIMAAIVDAVRIAPVDVRGRHTFDPSRLAITWKA